MIVYRCENGKFKGMYNSDSQHPKFPGGGMLPMRWILRTLDIDVFDCQYHIAPKFDFHPIDYQKFLDNRISYVFGFADIGQLNNWLSDRNVIYILKRVYDIRVNMYNTSDVILGLNQCVFNKDEAKLVDTYDLEDFVYSTSGTKVTPAHPKLVELID